MFVSSQLELKEGSPDLGGTSYFTDKEGNVVFGPNTPKEKMKTTVTGTKMQKRKREKAVWCLGNHPVAWRSPDFTYLLVPVTESAAKTLPGAKIEGNEERKSEEKQEQKEEGMKANVVSDSADVVEEAADQPVQLEAVETLADTEPEAETGNNKTI